MVRAEQAELRRRQILHIALDRFIAKGYYGTSTREIAKIAGISSGLMFHYFSSKQALYESLVENGCEKMIFDFEVAKHNPLGYYTQLLQGIFNDLQTNIPFAKMFVFMDQALHAPGISQRANELLSSHDVTRQCIPIIQRGQEMGQLRPGNPHALAIAFFGAIQGVAQEMARDPATPLPDACWILDIIRER